MSYEVEKLIENPVFYNRRLKVVDFLNGFYFLDCLLYLKFPISNFNLDFDL